MGFPIGFSLLKQNTIEEDVPLPITSNAVAANDLIALGAGSTTWADGTSSTEHWQMKAVATETVASTATSVKARLVTPGQLWVAESANNSDATHNGDRMVLTDTNTVNNTGTDSTAQTACFIQMGTVGAAADKRILGMIVYGTGVDPDAA